MPKDATTKTKVCNLLCFGGFEVLVAVVELAFVGDAPAYISTSGSATGKMPTTPVDRQN
ncbi:hypothetical protein M378DRAFT_163065 [Amanita muscaria Koide BX008]|uniref:Uncharacterized protein n=1 Tax=Amanita muscaria (strain Koide BX008) TaxID=946122 RepID=A0A0C2WSF1_AMAMK|nr:hypothetical protein M378DRAFT_163065 [Amanita muscaria Koide BX008]